MIIVKNNNDIETLKYHGHLYMSDDNAHYQLIKVLLLMAEDRDHKAVEILKRCGNNFSDDQLMIRKHRVWINQELDFTQVNDILTKFDEYVNREIARVTKNGD